MITVERIAENDLPALYGLYGELIEDENDLGWMKARFGELEKDPDCALRGAKDQAGGLLGSILPVKCRSILGDCRPFMVVECVIVSERARRPGVRKALFQKADELAKEWDCGYSILVSSPFCTAAHEFYQSIGYEMGSVKGFHKHY